MPPQTCGQSTDWVWSFQRALGDPAAPLPSCVKSDFPDFRYEADMFYFAKVH